MNTISSSNKTLVITGAVGFIGSTVVRKAIERGYQVVAFDKLTYAANFDSIAELVGSPNFVFIRGDICDGVSIRKILEEFRPSGLVHLAAESHVDRSIDRPSEFIRTNIEGTFCLLEETRHYLERSGEGKGFRFHHVSTDEVYGDLGESEARFSEDTPYDPSSPYSASKAASDHLVRSWGRTFGVPYLITNCSNNYGARQFPEKLIPHVILCALSGKALPLYGDGKQIRDWLYVEDHATAILELFERGAVGETYNIGGGNELQNIEVVERICSLLEELAPERKTAEIRAYRDLIKYVTDRPGHDTRYAVDTSKIEREIGWVPQESFESGLRKTISWYLENEQWWRPILEGNYRVE